MNLTSIAEADRFAEQAHREREDAADRARYAEDLADALALDRLALVRHDWAPPSWTVTYQGQVIGEVTNERDDAVIGGWMAHPLEGEPRSGRPTRRSGMLSAGMPRLADERSIRPGPRWKTSRRTPALGGRG